MRWYSELALYSRLVRLPIDIFDQRRELVNGSVESTADVSMFQGYSRSPWLSFFGSLITLLGGSISVFTLQWHYYALLLFRYWCYCRSVLDGLSQLSKAYPNELAAAMYVEENVCSYKFTSNPLCGERLMNLSILGMGLTRVGDCRIEALPEFRGPFFFISCAVWRDCRSSLLVWSKPGAEFWSTVTWDLVFVVWLLPLPHWRDLSQV